jgi:hypothetical protein
MEGKRRITVSEEYSILEFWQYFAQKCRASIAEGGPNIRLDQQNLDRLEQLIAAHGKEQA